MFSSELCVHDDIFWCTMFLRSVQYYTFIWILNWILIWNFEQSLNLNVSHVRLFHIFNFLLHLVDCEWATWENWMKCTATCGGGVKMRTRRTLTCTNALSCKGSFIEQKICSTESCPDLSTLKADVATLKTDGKNINE